MARPPPLCLHSWCERSLCQQEQLEHAEVSTALRYLGQYYFKNKLYDEASLCAQRCCDYNDVSAPCTTSLQIEPVVFVTCKVFVF